MPRCAVCDRVKASAEINKRGKLPRCKDKYECAKATAKVAA